VTGGEQAVEHPGVARPRFLVGHAVIVPRGTDSSPGRSRRLVTVNPRHVGLTYNGR
jgi:hypothetical protein